MTEAECWARDLACNESEAFGKALKITKEEKTMYIDGRWLTEPEIEAYIKRLRREIAELRNKHENKCRQISEYDIEVRTLREQQNVNDKLERITASYTFGQQRAVFIEECAEAIQASCKLERASNSSPEEYEQRRKALISEIADVIIMAEQMRIYLGRDQVDAEIQKKLERQLQRIKEEAENE